MNDSILCTGSPSNKCVCTGTANRSWWQRHSSDEGTFPVMHADPLTTRLPLDVIQQLPNCQVSKYTGCWCGPPCHHWWGSRENFMAV